MKYPDWTDFPIDHIGYGFGGPVCGIGAYTVDRKYSWPDPELSTPDEISKWKTWVESQGYEVPSRFLVRLKAQDVIDPTKEEK